MQYITGHISKKHLWIPSGKCEITKIISNKYRSNNFALPFPSFLSFYWYLLQHFFCHFDMADTPFGFFGFFVCVCDFPTINAWKRDCASPCSLTCIRLQVFVIVCTRLADVFGYIFCLVARRFLLSRPQDFHARGAVKLRSFPSYFVPSCFAPSRGNPRTKNRLGTR